MPRFPLFRRKLVEPVKPKNHLESSALPSVDSICRWCRYSEQTAPSTSARGHRSGQQNKNQERLRESIREGCWICKAYVAATVLWATVDLGQPKGSVKMDVRYDVERFTLGASDDLPRLQIYCPTGQSQVFRFIADAELPSTASSATSLNFITSNLNQCLQSHSSCRSYQAILRPGINDKWPRRVLTIDVKKSTVRLVDFKQSMSSKYVALSYCWGDQSGQLTATKTSLPSLRTGVKISKLPATLRDAVLVTIHLGSNLIWIDSMCIIQDDKNDWIREAGKMSTVYAQAMVTIIASSARSCSEGFLEALRGKSIRLSQVRAGNQVVEIRARVLYDWGHHRGGPQSHESCRYKWVDPVDRRAWTLQERLLSGRYINFTSGEVQWGCMSTRACECGQTLYGQLYEFMPPEERWFVVVQEYATRKLSVSTDKLTALAGVARNFSDNMEWSWYAAGLWLSRTPTQLSARSLVWQRPVNSSMDTCMMGYIAPSFSWASIDGAVWHRPAQRFSNSEYPSRILSVEMYPQTEDSFGSVRAGVLRMKGPLIRGKLAWKVNKASPELQAKITVDGEKAYSPSVSVDGTLERVPLSPGRYTVRRKPLGSTNSELEFGGVDIGILPIMVEDIAYQVRPTKIEYSNSKYGLLT